MDLTKLPEVEFASSNVETMLAEAKVIVEETLGRTIERGDPLMLFLKSLLAIILQQRLLIDKLAKDNLLAYSTAPALDHIGALVGVERLPAASAVTTAEIKLSAPRETSTTIKQGTRITAGDEINFALDETVIFLAGETVKQGKVTCTETGTVGNDYAPGEINKIVDPQPFLSEMYNITKSEGGADVESDDSLRERIRIAPESFSVAGPDGAYEYFTKQVSSLIVDVFVYSPEPGEVNIYPLLDGGELPETEILEAVAEHLNDRKIRPLTDLVRVLPPEIVGYELDVEYWISRNDSAVAGTIQAKVEQAIEDFIKWQRSKLGRDLNRTELEYRIRAAGAKRAEIHSPQFSVIAQNAIAVCDGKTITYAGLEDE